jgi:hypothetical protein
VVALQMVTNMALRDCLGASSVVVGWAAVPSMASPKMGWSSRIRFSTVLPRRKLFSTEQSRKRRLAARGQLLSVTLSEVWEVHEWYQKLQMGAYGPYQPVRMRQFRKSTKVGLFSYAAQMVRSLRCSY